VHAAFMALRTRIEGAPAVIDLFCANSRTEVPNGKRCMYHTKTAFWPQSNPYFAAFNNSPKPPDDAPVLVDPGARSAIVTRTDMQIEQDVRDELKMESSVRAAAIDVQVSDGVVTLSGVVDGEGERWLIEAAAKRIAGVRKILTRMTVFSPDITPADDDIAHDCERVLSHLTPKDDYTIAVQVSKGWVTLSGEVAEGFERRIAETEVSSLLSVLGVNSQVRVRSSMAAGDAAANGVSSIRKPYELKSGSYEFSPDNDRVTWASTVHSWNQHRAQLSAAWSSSGTKRTM
jgi:osmotically-inducible protein OsmY